MHAHRFPPALARAHVPSRARATTHACACVPACTLACAHARPVRRGGATRPAAARLAGLLLLVGAALAAGACRARCSPCKPCTPCTPRAAQAPAAAPAVRVAPSAPSPQERARQVRAALLAPSAPWSFEGELVGLGARLGRVELHAEPGTFGAAPCWVVSERTVREHGAARVVTESTLSLAPDLALLRSETVLRAPGGGSLLAMGWRDGRLEVHEEAGDEARAAALDAPREATSGLFALLAFARALPAQDLATPGAAWRLEVADGRLAFGDDKGQPLPAGRADLELAVVDGAPAGATLVLEARAASGRALRLHLDRATRAVQRIEGLVPALSIVPRGAPGLPPAPAWFARVGEPPQDALSAFVTFGRGYHLPRRDLLEAAFHWPSMRDHEVAAGTYPAGTAPERVREDFCAEFERMSKHRSEGDCDDLLVQLLLSATLTTHADGSVTVDTLPAYGDHAYTMAPRDGRWWIVRVD